MPVLPGAQPWSSDGGDVGALVLHGFTGSPQGVRPWGEALAAGGLTVRVPRLPGHGTTWQEPEHHPLGRLVHRRRDRARRACARAARPSSSPGCRSAARSPWPSPSLRGADVDAIALVNPAVRFDDPRLRALPVLKHLVPSLSGIGSDIAKEGAVEPGLPAAAAQGAALRRRRHRRGGPRACRASPSRCWCCTRRRTTWCRRRAASLVLSRVSSKDVTDVVLGRAYHVATLDHDASTIEHETLKLAQRVAG
ncbi:esterase [Angustibacter aerolatus]|uniref:Esterase n=1 Tax=Angustibacter aerolatus TaxID=1162965 RepID=A0ABQ6JM68_9ACTN|nr:esterase [Angustibacter aerolatus]